MSKNEIRRHLIQTSLFQTNTASRTGVAQTHRGSASAKRTSAVHNRASAIDPQRALGLARLGCVTRAATVCQ